MKKKLTIIFSMILLLEVNQFFYTQNINFIKGIPIQLNVNENLSITKDYAEELALNTYKNAFIDPYDVKIVESKRITIEHPIDSGNTYDVWHIVVDGKGTEKESGKLVTSSIYYDIDVETGEILDSVSVGSELSYITIKELFLDIINKFLIYIILCLLLVFVVMYYKKGGKKKLVSQIECCT